MAGPPKKLVTFLFTDIEGSTALWERDPDAMRGALLRHDGILHGLIALHRGEVFKMTGDGFDAAFGRAAAALDAAVAIRDVIERTPWRGLGELRVRVAVHTGEAEYRDGDYFGQTVNRAARLLATAEGGQVLVSEATVGQAQGRLPPGVSLRDLGDVRLRDVAEPIRVYTVEGRRDPDEVGVDRPDGHARDVTRSEMPGVRDDDPGGRGAAREILELPAAAPDADTLRIYTLGGFRIERGGRQIHPNGRKSLPGGQLFKCLLTRETRRLVRDEAFELFFEKSGEAAKDTIRSQLSRFRDVVEPGMSADESVIVYRNGIVAIRPRANVWVDADAFEQLVARARRADAPDDLLEEADRLYGGDYLPDDLYADWAGPRREALRRLWTGLQVDLARARERRGDVDGAATALQRLLGADPCDERAARALMLLLAQHGRRPEALRAFQRLAEALAKELMVEPSADTLEVRRRIVNGEVLAADTLNRTVSAPTSQADGRPPPPLAKPAVSAPDGGPSEFPPPVGATRHASTLPAPTTALIGREREVADVRALLLCDDVRLVTLTGPGGVGKTRLAVEVAHLVREEFRDGVWFVPLAPISDGSLVVPTVAQVLGVREAPDRPLLESLVDHLREREALLLADNFEQVVSAASKLSNLLAAAPRLKILVTSRFVLRLSGEHAVAVPPLALPDADGEPSAKPSEPSPSVRLFVERARAVRLDFALTRDNGVAVAEICRRVDGLPLALELAAARVRHLPPAALLGRLAQRLPLLTGGPRDLPGRQRTLRDAIAWSYDLLDPAERRLFRRLAMFAGGCTLEAAERVCDAEGDLGIDVLDGLASLVDKSLLQQVDGLDGEPRYVMLETIREYAREQLEASGELHAIRGPFVDFFLALAEEASQKLLGREQREWLRRLDADLDHLRAVLGWSRDGEIACEAGLRLAGALVMYWEFRGFAIEGHDWVMAILALPGASARTVARARALYSAAFLVAMRGDFATERSLAQESATIFREAEDLRAAGRSLAQQAVAEARLGNRDMARSLLEQSVAIAREYGDTWGLAFALGNLGDVAYQEADFAAARQYREAAASLAREISDCHTLGLALAGLALVARVQGNLDKSAKLFNETLRVGSELKDQWIIPRAIGGLAGAAVLAGNYVRAARLFGATAAMRGVSGIKEAARSFRVMYERDEAEARTALGDETFAAAWAEGRAMTVEQAVAYALDEQGTA